MVNADTMRDLAVERMKFKDYMRQVEEVTKKAVCCEDHHHDFLRDCWMKFELLSDRVTNTNMPMALFTAGLNALKVDLDNIMKQSEVMAREKSMIEEAAKAMQSIQAGPEGEKMKANMPMSVIRN